MVWVAWEVSVQVINVNISHLVFVRRCASDLGQTVAGPLLIENKCYPVLQSNCVSTAVHSLCNWGPDVCKHTKMIITFTHFYVAPVTLTRSVIFHSRTRLAFTLLHGCFFPPRSLQLMLQLYVKPLLEYHRVITLMPVISVTLISNACRYFAGEHQRFSFTVLSCVRQIEFFFRHALIQDKAKNAERNAGEGTFLYIISWIMNCIHPSLWRCVVLHKQSREISMLLQIKVLQSTHFFSNTTILFTKIVMYSNLVYLLYSTLPWYINFIQL